MRKTLCSLVLGLATLTHADYPMFFPWDTGHVINEPDLPERENVLHENKECEKIDLMFLVDTTGSMIESIRDVRFYMSYLMDEITQKYKDVRFAVSRVEDHPIYPYGEIMNVPYGLMHDFSYDIDSIEKVYAYLSPNYGGDLSESYAYALRSASNETGWRDNAKRFIILFADSDDRDDYSLREAIIKNNAIVLGIVKNPRYWRNKLKAVSKIGFSADPIIRTIEDSCKPLICRNKLKVFNFI